MKCVNYSHESPGLTNSESPITWIILHCSLRKEDQVSTQCHLHFGPNCLIGYNFFKKLHMCVCLYIYVCMYTYMCISYKFVCVSKHVLCSWQISLAFAHSKHFSWDIRDILLENRALEGQAGWYAPQISTFRRLRQGDCELEASIDYIVSSRPA